jgi:hypothetical protein
MPALFKPDRFDIEQEINEIGHFADIIKSYADMLYDGQRTQSSDDIHTTLHGFANLLDSHSLKMHETHCKHYDLNQYARKDYDGIPTED